MVEQQKTFHPGLNVLLSLEKAHTQFWGTDAGWEHTKRKRSKSKDWKRTYQNSLSQKVNQVWIQKTENRFGRQEVSTDQLKAQAERLLNGGLK